MPRLDPARLRQPWLLDQRRVRPADRLHGGQQLLAHPRIDAAPDLPGMAQAALIVHGHDQRAQVLVGPLSRQPADDHDLLLAAQLDLQPVPAAAAGLVGAEPALGHDPLQSLLGRRLREVDALAHDVGGVAHQPVGPQHPAQQVLAVLERHVHQRSPLEVQQVEDHVGHGDRLTLLAGQRWRIRIGPAGGHLQCPQPGLLLQPAERRPALLVEGDHLAVHDRLFGIDPRRGAGQVREVGGGIDAVARPDARPAAADHGLDPVAVPLDLVQPVIVVEGGIGQGGHHGRHEVGLAFLAGLRQVRRHVRAGWRLLEARRHAVLDLVVGAAGLDAGREVLGIPAIDRRLVALLDEQPLLALVAPAAAAAGADDGVATAQPLPEEAELQLARPDGARRVVGLLRLEGAPVPDDDVAGAVLAVRDHALEVEVLDRVVLGAHRQPLLVGIQGRPLGHRPADEDAIHLQPGVVVEGGGPMTLHHEAPAAIANLARLRLGGAREVALGPIALERHRFDDAIPGWHAACGPVAGARPTPALR